MATRRHRRTEEAAPEAQPESQPEAAEAAVEAPKAEEPKAEEPVAEAKQPAKAPAKPAPKRGESTPLRVLPKVNLEVYLRAQGKRADQTAGFRRWVKGRSVTRMTIPDWDKLWTEFQGRPIR